tara:strand:+ start:257 stop:391 length:135 start_codon:yes stop_codon:yes gene_type:complete
MVLPFGGRVCRRLPQDRNSNVAVFFLLLTQGEVNRLNEQQPWWR